MKRKYFYLSFLLCFCCLSLPSPSYSALPESINLIQTYPFLKDISSYYQVIDLKKHKPDINFLGSAAVGNGYCFGLIGTKFPQNTIYGLIGPDYETDERFFSNVSTLVKLNKETLSSAHQSVYKVKRSAIVLTEETFDEGLTLYTVTFAPPDKRYILRINIIKNNSSKDIEDLTILMNFLDNNSKKLQNFLYQRIKNKFMTAGFLSSEAEIKDGEIKEHYPFLKRNLLGQYIGNDFLLPFHGDETYQVYALHTFYKPLAKLYSADTAFEYVTAGRGMKKIAEKLNLLSDSKRYNELSETIYKKTEDIFFNSDKNYYYPAIFKDNLKHYQFPFLNINLRPFWINYISPYRIKSKEWKKQRGNVTNSLKLLKVTPDNIVTSKRSRFITGMVPGYLLYNLSVINSPDADKIFSKMIMR